MASSENSKSILVVACGAPGSGKSTVINELAARYNFLVVCPDTIRGELFGDESDQRDGGKVFSIAYKRLREGLANPNFSGVMFDATNCRPRARRDVLSEADGFHATRICAVATTDLPTCLSRNAARSRKVPEEVIERMHSNLTSNWPATSEGFDYVVELDALENTLQSLLG